MWGFGGRCYWGRRERGGRKIKGIVVVFAWVSSQERDLRSYAELCASLGWDSLICHSQFLNMFFPEKATTLAFDVVNELVEELKIETCPVVFASFSGGSKACMYKALQIIEGKSEPQLNLDDHQLVRSCISGHIYDSSPVDLAIDLGSQFILHPTALKMSRPPRLVSWITHRIASGLDALFLNRFESQRAEYWQTLYSSVSIGAPYLICYSENDDLAPHNVICNFAQKLQDLGGDVELIKCNVGHSPVDYKAAVTEVLGKAAAVYSKQIQLHEGERLGGHEEISESISNLRFQQVDSPSNSLEYYDVGSMHEESKEDLIQLPSRQSITAHGLLGQILFDACVPKDVQDWDVGSSASFTRQSFASTPRYSPFNPVKFIRRSRL